MSLRAILSEAKKHEAKFNTVEEWQAWQQAEQLKDGEVIFRARQEAKAKRLLNTSNIPLLHRGCSFDNYRVGSQDQKHVLDIARYYAQTFDDQSTVGRCMVFFGNTGTGKNHLAAAIANHIISTGYSAQIIKVSDLMSRYRTSYRNDSRVSEEMITSELTNIDLLVLDEVGLAHGSNDEVVQINRIIDGRMNNLKPTLMLTNLDVPEFVRHVGDRNFDRLQANGGAVVEFNWESYRRKGNAA